MTKNKQTFSIRETAEILVPDIFGRRNYLIALGVSLVMFTMIAVLYPKLPRSVPLYFTMPWGEARLASKMALYVLPVISMVFLIFNLALGRLSTKLSPLLPRVLAVSTVVVTCMIMIALIGIVQSLIL